MKNIFEITEKSGRKIRLTKTQWTHITSSSSPHAYMNNHLEDIKETLIKPDNMIQSVYDEDKVNYYRYYKSKNLYLRVIVRYLNGDGFVVTSYFVRDIAK